MGTTDAAQVVTLAIFIISYILIFSGKFERTTAALLGVFIMVTCGYLFGFMNFEEVLGFVDWEVIILLFGMMTYVGIMAKTGFFKYLGIRAIRLSKGKPWLIFLYLSLITTFISMIIDNVTTILLIIPITVELAEMLEINPIPVMLGEAVLSNIGGVGTMIGDPPNIMIGIASGYTFNEFIIHLFPPVLTALLFSVILSRIIYRKWLAGESKHIEELMKREPWRYLKNKKKMRYLLYILAGMILFFALEGVTGISPSFVALAGGTLALFASMEDPREAFKSVEWSTLVFFIALFSLVGGLHEVGLLSSLAEWLLSISGSTVILALIILWVSGISSSFVDNIPITAALIPVISIMAEGYHSDIFWWALAMGVGMGGNITPIGSSAGVITLSLSKRYGHEIHARDWLMFGTVMGIVGMVICSVFLFMMA